MHQTSVSNQIIDYMVLSLVSQNHHSHMPLLYRQAGQEIFLPYNHHPNIITQHHRELSYAKYLVYHVYIQGWIIASNMASPSVVVAIVVHHNKLQKSSTFMLAHSHALEYSISRDE